VYAAGAAREPFLSASLIGVIMMRISSLLSTVVLVGVAAACSSESTDSSTADLAGEPCPVLSPPGPDFCPDGTIVGTTDADGCPGFACEPAATCESVGGECVSLSPSSCENGRWADAAEFSCSGAVGVGCCLRECPMLSPPHPDFCPDGAITPQKDATGCIVGFDCVPESSAECPMLSPPHPDFCPDGTLVPIKDDDDCTVGFDCVES
jgi:hypothetical protein